ncbi:MAG: branched-chain amino acid transport system substrate-binding protein [Miltoncostaeaceae bacterium]|nr:branched-chain amino acid transport system substrate-binding protein [Miltoncostaeaceae bacterium]
MNRKHLTLAAALMAVVLVGIAAGCGGGSAGGVSALPASSCSPIVYEGPGDPDILIASDLPLQGANRPQTVQMTEAIKFLLAQRNYTAGTFHVAYQSCDDATAQAGAWDSAKCSANAAAYAENRKVVGIIGTFNSGCVKLIIPVTNRAPDGPVGIISPVNSYVGLTHAGPGTVAGEPDIYYPTGKRNFVRIVAADDYQGAADAMFIKSVGVTSVYYLNDKDNYGFGVATNTRNAMNALGGVSTAGFEAWDKNASSYEALARRVKDSGANGVFLGGTIDHNGGKLIKDLRTVLGTGVPIFTPDGFTPAESIVSGAGAAAEGVYLSIAGLPLAQLGPAGQAFVKDFGTQVGGTPQVYAAYAAQAAQVLLDAIANSDGTRAAVNANLQKATVKDGILGTFAIDEKGDTTQNPVTIYQLKNGIQTTVRVITPPPSLVAAS